MLLSVVTMCPQVILILLGGGVDDEHVPLIPPSQAKPPAQPVLVLVATVYTVPSGHVHVPLPLEKAPIPDERGPCRICLLNVSTVVVYVFEHVTDCRDGCAGLELQADDTPP